MGRRALWKRPYVDPELIQDITRMFLSGYPQTLPFMTDSRQTTIIPEFVGLRFEIHNGRDYIPLEVKQEHVGMKFGQFAYSRRLPTSIYDHGKK